MSNIIIKDGIAYNRWSKSKYRDIFPSEVTWCQKKSQKKTAYTCKINGKTFNFKKVDTGNNNGWINLMCIERNKIIRARTCNNNTVYLYKSKIDTNFFIKNDNIIYLNRYLI